MGLIQDRFRADPCRNYMANGSFYQLGVLVVAVFIIRALPLVVCIMETATYLAGL